MTQHEHKLWILALTVSRARILRCADRQDDPAELILAAEAPHLRTYLAMPQLNPSSPPDPVAEDRKDFFRQVIALLDCHRRACDFDLLAICAEDDVLYPFAAMLPPFLLAATVRAIAHPVFYDAPDDLRRIVASRIGFGGGSR